MTTTEENVGQTRQRKIINEEEISTSASTTKNNEASMGISMRKSDEFNEHSLPIQ
jgi:hypothetical protein